MIRLENIVVKFGDFTALHDINVHVKEGEFFTFLGPSGCGKTTTLRIIAGFLEPDEGDVIFDGKRINGMPPHKRQVNTIFQRYALFPHLNVYENIAFGLKLKKLPKADIDSKVKEMLSLVNLKGFEHRNINSLSGGQQQRVAIARALVKRPAVLLLDEPLSNLDARLRLQTREEIRRIQRETNITTVFVTHDQEEAMSISDQIVVMKLGVVQQMGVPQEVYNNPANLFVAKFLGTPPVNVFRGEVKGGALYIADERICDTPGISDRAVYVGIRPEGFIYSPNGVLTCDFQNVEVMGGAISIVSSHKESENAIIRATVMDDVKIPEGAATVKFDIKPNKLYVFDRETEERLYF